MTGSERRVLVALLLVALAARVAVALAWDAPLTGDAVDYDRLAAGLAAGDGYVNDRGEPTAWRPPGYPAFLAVVYRALGSGRLGVGLVQALVGTASVAAVYALAAPVLGTGAALVGAALVAVDVVQLALVARRLSEGPFTLALLLLVLASVRLRARLREDASPWGWAAAAGVLGGVGTLTRGLFVGFPLLLAGALVLEARTRRAAGAALLVLAAYGLVLLPWALRNVGAVGAPVPVATQGGLTLYASWFPPGETVLGMLPRDSVTRAAEGLSEVERNDFFVAATVRGLAEEPGRIPRLLALKALYLVVPFDWEVLPLYGALNPTYLVSAAWAAAFLLGLGAGRRREAWPLWLPLAYLAGMTVVFYGSPRLRAPVDPLLAALAGGAVVELARRRGARFAAAALGASALGAGALALLAAPIKAAALGVLRATGVWKR